jgi:hypothetical protein
VGGTGRRGALRECGTAGGGYDACRVAIGSAWRKGLHDGGELPAPARECGTTAPDAGVDACPVAMGVRRKGLHDRGGAGLRRKPGTASERVMHASVMAATWDRGREAVMAGDGFTHTLFRY